MATLEFDCISCGACCFAGHDRYVVLLPADRDRAIPEDATHEVDGRRYLRMTEGHCAQLCRTEAGKLVCGIYEVRPEACRAFRPGSFECLQARRRRGEEAARMRQGAAPPAPPPGAPAESGSPHLRPGPVPASGAPGPGLRRRLTV